MTDVETCTLQALTSFIKLIMNARHTTLMTGLHPSPSHPNLLCKKVSNCHLSELYFLPHQITYFNLFLSCVKNHPEISPLTSSTFFYLAIPQEESPGTPPRPVATPPVITVKRGDKARFHCDANSDSPAEVHWRGADNGPLRGDAIQEGDDLIIENADESTAGEYICQATNQFGTGQSEPVRLIITDSKFKTSGYYLCESATLSFRSHYVSFQFK
jgi:hypothetical protein